MCPILKKLQNELRPYRKVTGPINEILKSKKGDDCRVVEHLLSFAEHQFGKEVTGKHYREREDGERISNWIADIQILYRIISKMSDLYGQDNFLSTIVQEDMSFPYLERSLNLLNPWMINLDSDASNGIDSLDEDQINYLVNMVLKQLYYTEQNMAIIAMSRRQFDTAEGHCQRCLAYSRRYGLEGEEKITMIFTALKLCCSLRNYQDNYSDALSFAEEGYNLVVEAYDPAHPQVQEAAGKLIEVLISKRDLFDAERYAQVTYSNLRDKKNGIDQESEVVAEGAYNLANVIYKQGRDLMKAEELARESLRIASLIKDSNQYSVGGACNLLANILIAQGQLGDETRGLYERFLAISIRSDGPDGSNTAAGNNNLGRYYHHLAVKQASVDLKQTHLLLAKAHFEESRRIESKMCGHDNPGTVNNTFLAAISSELSRISPA
jgi:tetratricopeptide (TPR) repeat protein